MFKFIKKLPLYSFYLTPTQKIKLIEILLIVGAILAGFKLTDRLFYFFMLFVLVSIVYFIQIQGKIRNKISLFIFSGLISFSFVGIVSYNFFIALYNNTVNDGFTIFLYLVYFVLFSIILFFTLYNEKAKK